jgi:hypothetical protein
MVPGVRLSDRSVKNSPTASHVMPFNRATFDPVDLL